MSARVVPIALAALLAPGESARPVPGASRYFVTDRGRVFSSVNGARALQLLHHPKGYVHVNVQRDPDPDRPARWQPYLHELVALAFIGPRPTAPGVAYEVDHLNGDKSDNRAANLEYVTKAENYRRAVAAGRVPSVKLSASDVWEYRCAAHGDDGADVVARIVHERGVATVTARDALAGRSWRAVPDPASRPTVDELVRALGLPKAEAYRLINLSPFFCGSVAQPEGTTAHIIAFRSNETSQVA